MMAGTHEVDIFQPIPDEALKKDSRERDRSVPDENGCIDGFCPMPTRAPDQINPPHYQQGPECIDVMRAISTDEQFQGHLWLTSMKYLYRLHAKDQPLVNVEKAIWYLERLKQELSK